MMVNKFKNLIKQFYVIRTIKRGGLFDKEYYLKNNLDVARRCMNPIKHYVRHGWKEGRNPTQYFDTKWYLESYTDVANSSMNPFYHFVKYGIKENRKPSLDYSNYYHLNYEKNGFDTPKKTTKINFNLIGPIDTSLKERYKNRKVSIVLPVYNAYSYLEKLLDSIYKNSDIKFDLIAINDKSTDKRIEPLLQKYSMLYDNFKFLQNPDNIGFVKTINRGLKFVTESDILIVNSDVEVPQNWLSRMFHPIWSKPKVASVTPMSNSATIMSFPKFGHNNLFEEMSLQEVDDEFQRLNPDSEIYIESPTGHGFCMAMSWLAINQVGLFDENAFGRGYGEENDWCMRAKKNGFKNLIATNIFLFHKHQGSFDKATRNRNMHNNMKVLLGRYPEYKTEVEHIKQDNKYESIRGLLFLFVAAKKASKTILRFEHSHGGGSAFACKDYIENNKADTLCLIIRPLTLKKYELEIFYRDYTWSFALEPEDDLFKLFEHIKINKIIINQLVGYEKIKEILSIITKIKRIHSPSTEMNIRDFFTVCPRYNLMYMDETFCDLESVKYDCNLCYSKLIAPRLFRYNFPTVNIWRKMWSDFFKYIDTVIVFSKFTESILLKCYPDIESKIVKFDISIRYLRKARIAPHSSVNIAIIGNINRFKGSSIALKLVRLAKADQKRDIKLFLFGKTNNYELRNKIIYKGVFKREALPALMEQNRIDIIFVPSIVGETFCRTAQEAIEMGMPVAAFNIGAPPERIGKYDKGLIIDKIDAEYALKCILKFIQNYRSNDAKLLRQKNIDTNHPNTKRFGIEKNGLQKKILLINDTSQSINLGCKITSNVLYNLFGLFNQKSAICDNIPLGYWSESFRDISVKPKECMYQNNTELPSFLLDVPSVPFHIWKSRAESLKSSDLDLCERIKNCDAVFVNGEGTIHHNSIRGLALLALMKTAIDLNRQVLLINTTIQAMEPKILEYIIPKLKFVHVREKQTLNELKKFNSNILCVPDIIFLTNQNVFLESKSFPKYENFCLITAGVLAQVETIKNLFDMVKSKGLKPFYLCIGDGGEGKLASKVCRENDVDMIFAWEIPTEEIVSFLSKFQIAISGRHHMNICLLGAGVPFIPIPSNTWKVEETLSMVKYPIDVVRRKADLSEQLDYILKNRDALTIKCRESFETGKKMTQKLLKRIEICGY